MSNPVYWRYQWKIPLPCPHQCHLNGSEEQDPIDPQTGFLQKDQADMREPGV